MNSIHRLHRSEAVSFAGKPSRGWTKKAAVGLLGLASVLPMVKPDKVEANPPVAVRIQEKKTTNVKAAEMDKGTQKIVVGAALLMAAGALGQAFSLALRGLFGKDGMWAKKPPKQPEPPPNSGPPKPSNDTVPPSSTTPTAAKTPEESQPDEIDEFFKKLDQDELRKLGLDITPEDLKRLLEEEKKKS